MSLKHAKRNSVLLELHHFGCCGIRKTYVSLGNFFLEFCRFLCVFFSDTFNNPVIFFEFLQNLSY